MSLPEVPPALEAEHTRLEPLAEAHRADLSAVAFDPRLWRWTPTQIHTPADLDAYIHTARAELANGTTLPFAILDRSTGRAIGSTRLGHIDLDHRRAEIGWSWLGRAYQRRAFNTEAKLLLLRYAFEDLNCMRVEIRADRLNQPSRTAIERLGAVEEGTLRQHMILPDGRRVDWVYYSILRDEWPDVEAGLTEKLARYAGG
ncbi:MAG: GNAT family protein [Rubricoccaceae bacterium]